MLLRLLRFSWSNPGSQHNVTLPYWDACYGVPSLRICFGVPVLILLLHMGGLYVDNNCALLQRVGSCFVGLMSQHGMLLHHAYFGHAHGPALAIQHNHTWTAPSRWSLYLTMATLASYDPLFFCIHGIRHTHTHTALRSAVLDQCRKCRRCTTAPA